MDTIYDLRFFLIPILVLSPIIPILVITRRDWGADQNGKRLSRWFWSAVMGTIAFFILLQIFLPILYKLEFFHGDGMSQSLDFMIQAIVLAPTIGGLWGILIGNALANNENKYFWIKRISLVFLFSTLGMVYFVHRLFGR